MKKGHFFAQVEDVNNILSKSNLLKNYLRKTEYQNFSRDIYRTDSCLELHSQIINEGDYSFQLFDDSLIQFAYNQKDDSLTLGYVYVPFPLKAQSYKDYLVSYDLKVDDVGDLFKEEYEQYLSEAPINHSALVIRYDYSTKEYCETVHSVSHLHVGFNKISITSKKILNPVTFILFILKQVYYQEWKRLINTSFFLDYFKRYKDMCEDVPKNFFTHLDEKELHLI